jgi:hypothetical protein
MAKRLPRSMYQQYGAHLPSSRRRLAWWVYLLIGVPVVALVALGVYIGSVAMATQQAMDKVFQPPVRPTYATARATAGAVAGAPTAAVA